MMELMFCYSLIMTVFFAAVAKGVFDEKGVGGALITTMVFVGLSATVAGTSWGMIQ